MANEQTNPDAEALIARWGGAVCKALCCPSGACGNAESKYRVCQAHTFADDAAAAIRALLPAIEGEWFPIETAPRDGTMLDLWIDDGRHTNVYWGRPQHTCGEAGSYCDCCPSYDGWVCADLNAYLTGAEGYSCNDPTHWRPLPSPPRGTALPDTKGGE